MQIVRLWLILLCTILAACGESSDTPLQPQPGVFEIQLDEELDSAQTSLQARAFRHDEDGENLAAAAVGILPLDETRRRLRYVDLEPAARRSFSLLSLRYPEATPANLSRIDVTTFLALPNRRYALLNEAPEAACSSRPVTLQLSGRPADANIVSASSRLQTRTLDAQSSQDDLAELTLAVCEPATGRDRTVFASAITDLRRRLDDVALSRYGLATLNPDAADTLPLVLDRGFSNRQLEVVLPEALDFGLAEVTSFLGASVLNLGDDAARIGLANGFPVASGLSQTAWEESQLQHRIRLFLDLQQGLDRRRGMIVTRNGLQSPVADPVRIEVPEFPFADLTFDPVGLRSYAWQTSRERAPAVGLLSIQGLGRSENDGAGQIINWQVVFDPSRSQRIRLPQITEALELLRGSEQLSLRMQQFDLIGGQDFDAFWLGDALSTELLAKLVSQSSTPIRSGSEFLSVLLEQQASSVYSELFLPEEF